MKTLTKIISRINNKNTDVRKKRKRLLHHRTSKSSIGIISSMSIIVGVCALFTYVNSNTSPVNQLPIKDYTIIGDSVDASVTTTTSTTTSSTATTTTTTTNVTNTTTTKGKTTTNTTNATDITTNTSTNISTTTASVNTIAVDTDDEATLTNTETNVENVEETYADTYDEVYDTSTDDVTYYEEPDIITYDEQPVETYIESVETSTETPEQTVVNEPAEESNNGGMTLLGNLRITGYVAYNGAHTANGDVPYVGGVAMSTSYGLPYGTTIYIEGLGYYTLNDTGCAYGVVDVFCNSVGDCYNLPAYCNVYVVE